MSDDGAHALVIIAFIGSVFSPYYAWARQRQGAQAVDARQHCALNVAVYSRGQARWTMTERGPAQLQQSAAALRIGPSSLHWDDRGGLLVRINERAAPVPRQVQGEVHLRPLAWQTQMHALDAAGRHRWWPMAPSAEVAVDLRSPGLRWRGQGYLDSNRGDEPLADAFVRWHWARAHLPDGRTAVVYRAQRRDGSLADLGWQFAPGQPTRAFQPPPDAALPPGGWGVRGEVAADHGHTPRCLKMLEDGPFYTRALVATRWQGQAVTTMHESLDLDRFRQRWVQALLPFRMPRWAPGA